MTPTPQDDLEAAAIKCLEMRGFVVDTREAWWNLICVVAAAAAIVGFCIGWTF